MIYIFRYGFVRPEKGRFEIEACEGDSSNTDDIPRSGGSVQDLGGHGIESEWGKDLPVGQLLDEERRGGMRRIACAGRGTSCLVGTTALR